MATQTQQLPDLGGDEKQAAATAQLVAEQKPKHDDGAGVLQNTLRVEWESDEDNGKHTVSMTGRLRFEVTEHVLQNGEIVYRCGLFRSDQEDLKDAIAVAVKNAANKAFTSRWNELFPPEQRERKQREKLSEKASRLDQKATALEQIVAEMGAAMTEGRDVNFGLFDELGVDPAQFGLQRPNAK